MSKKIKLVISLLTILSVFLMMSNIAHATLICPESAMVKNNMKIYCYYIGQKGDVLFPELVPDNGLAAYLDFIPTNVLFSNTKYPIPVKIDWERSLAGNYNLKLIQNQDIENMNVIIIKGISSRIVHDENYSKGNVEINFYLTNYSNHKEPVIIALNTKNKYYVLDKKKKIIELKPGQNIVTFNLKYFKNVAGSVNVTIKTRYFTKEMVIELDKEKMPYVNEEVPLFTLSNSNSNMFLIIDFILFILASVLFAMFVGRLGKVLIK